METSHRVVVTDARSMEAVEDDSVELVVTSPPYPMIEMWDGLFTELDPAVGDALAEEDGQAAFEAMHACLDAVWSELQRVLVPGGLACLNVGDATRSIGGRFRCFPNHARVLQAAVELGFEPLPPILWRKPTNSAAKFMGSGMLPPNAYATLEHEHILILRNGDGPRSFEPGSPTRYRSAYFWEERNRWFTDLWTDVAGTLQTLEDDGLRERSAAYPLEIPYRLINMFSVQGDTVLDPFWGTGTTTLAAMASARCSIGLEIDPELARHAEARFHEAPSLSRRLLEERLTRHEAFVEDRTEQGKAPGNASETYGFPVVTQQEARLALPWITELTHTPGTWQAEHAWRPVEEAPAPVVATGLAPGAASTGS